MLMSRWAFWRKVFMRRSMLSRRGFKSSGAWVLTRAQKLGSSIDSAKASEVSSLGSFEFRILHSLRCILHRAIRGLFLGAAGVILGIEEGFLEQACFGRMAKARISRCMSPLQRVLPCASYRLIQLYLGCRFVIICYSWQGLGQPTFQGMAQSCRSSSYRAAVNGQISVSAKPGIRRLRSNQSPNPAGDSQIGVGLQ